MRVRISLFAFAMVAALAVCTLPAFSAPRAESDSKRNVFIGLKDFAGFNKASGEKGEVVLISPEMSVPVNWDELIVSWNVPAGVYLKAEARAVFPDHTTKYFIMSKWSDNPAVYPRESVNHQRDDDGTVSIDTLELKRHGGKAQIRITLGSPKGGNTFPNCAISAFRFATAMPRFRRARRTKPPGARPLMCRSGGRVIMKAAAAGAAPLLSPCVARLLER